MNKTIQLHPLHSDRTEWKIVGEMEVRSLDTDSQEREALKKQGYYLRQCGVCIGEGNAGDIEGYTTSKREAMHFRGDNYRYCPVCEGAGWLAQHIDRLDEYVRLKKI